MLKYKACHTLPQGGLDIGLKVGILAEIGYMLQECAIMYFPLEPLKSLDMVIRPQRIQKNIRLFLKDKNLCSLGSCDHIHWFQWLQLAMHHGYVTLDGSHMHWNKQKDLKVMLEPKRSCTLLPGTHCINHQYHYHHLAELLRTQHSSQSLIHHPLFSWLQVLGYLDIQLLTLQHTVAHE